MFDDIIVPKIDESYLKSKIEKQVISKYCESNYEVHSMLLFVNKNKKVEMEVNVIVQENENGLFVLNIPIT